MFKFLNINSTGTYIGIRVALRAVLFGDVTRYFSICSD